MHVGSCKNIKNWLLNFHLKIGKIWKNLVFLKKIQNFWNFNFFFFKIFIFFSWSFPDSHMVIWGFIHIERSKVCFSVVFCLLSRTINWWIVESIRLILMTFYQNDNLREFQMIRDDWSSKRQTFKLNNKVKNALTQYVVSIFNSIICFFQCVQGLT